MVILPTQKIVATQIDPRVLIMYSMPKVGKTTILASLPNCLILDSQGGTDMVDAMKIRVIGLKPDPYSPPETPEMVEDRHAKQQYYLSEIIVALRAEIVNLGGKFPYQFGAFDVITDFEDWCEYEATIMYMASPQGRSWNRWDEDDVLAGARVDGKPVTPGTLKPKFKWDSVLKLGKGYGYQWLREAYRKWIDFLKPLFPTLVLSGHVRLVTTVKKEGKEVESKDLDLTGKNKQYTTGHLADVTGYLHRDGGKCYISFIASDEVICGSRCPHLEGQDILISEKMKDGTIKTYWNNIFKQLDKK